MNSTIFDTDIKEPIFIFIDGSYYCFYRYYALLNWWKNANPDEDLKDPFQNNIFVEKFRKTFVDNLTQITKKLKLHKNTDKPLLFVGKDCKRENIWRTQMFKDYKSNRNNNAENGFMGGPFFKMAYDEDLFLLGGVKNILKHPSLEADDCIAISVKYLIKKYPNCRIYIITSDKDYLQLNYKNITLINLTYKKIEDGKNILKEPEKDLKIKIIMGDISDNIPSIFPKCGFKTALKCIENKEFFNKKLMSNKTYKEQYLFNETLINFDKIPENLVDEFIETLKK